MKQTTLAAFGFSKTVKHRGRDIISKVVSETVYELKCHHCMKGFKNQQGLSVHLKCKHAANNVGEVLPETKCHQVSSADDVVEVITEGDSNAEILEPPVTVEKRRGRDIRKSITNKFKAKAIAAVERGEKAIEVANRLNISRGQVVENKR